MELIEQEASREAAGRDELRPALHGMWASVARRWADHAAFIDARMAPVTERMLELVQPRPGQRVLELACGPGGVGLAAAARVAPEGDVVLSDVAADMASIASGRADALGLSNVSTCELDLERIAQPDCSYDVVVCRDGLMLVLDPARAASEVRRVLRPGGRAAFAVWGPQERNPWLGILLDAVSAQLGSPIPPPGIPGPFSLDDRDRLSSILTEADLSEVVVGEVAVPFRASSFEEWWSMVSAVAGPIAQILASLPEDATRAIRASAHEAISAYATPTGLDIPGLSLIAAGRRP